MRKATPFPVSLSGDTGGCDDRRLQLARLDLDGFPRGRVTTHAGGALSALFHRDIGRNRNQQVGQPLARCFVSERARREERAVPYAWHLLEVSPRLCGRRKQDESPHRMASDHMTLRNSRLTIRN